MCDILDDVITKLEMRPVFEDPSLRFAPRLIYPAARGSILLDILKFVQVEVVASRSVCPTVVVTRMLSAKLSEYLINHQRF